MKYIKTDIAGLFIAESTSLADDRGSFTRIYCRDEEAAALGSDRPVAQINRSVTRSKGTVRGLHFQRAPALEGKMVRCTRGRVFDVVVDLRDGSPTFLKHHTEELSADNARALVVPEGFAHGFQALEDDCEMIYMHTTPYAREHEGGLRYDDPAIGVKWPLPAGLVSARDAGFELLNATFRGITA